MKATSAQQIIHAFKQGNKPNLEAFFKRFDTDFKGCLVLEDNLSALQILAENMHFPAFKKLASYKDDITTKFLECANGFVTEYYPLIEKYRKGDMLSEIIEKSKNEILNDFVFTFDYFYYCAIKIEAIAKKLSLQLSAEMQSLIELARQLNENSTN